jgi:mono/diheme cytochrome c family protein
MKSCRFLGKPCCFVERICFGGLLAALLMLSAGCGGSTLADFRSNEAYLMTQEFQRGEELDRAYRRDIQQNVKNILTALFGTPDEPRMPYLEDLDLSEIADPVKLQMAAGPVLSDRFGRPQGLYREHCAHCHGISGDGQGPTAAFLNPYPRDYRRGLFKFKSTPGTEPPTDDDLMRILYEGIPGTSMPSFRLLPGDELEALVHYVRYLSIRGQVERILLEEVMELDVDEREMLVDVSQPEAMAEQGEFILGIVADVVARWQEAGSLPVPVPAPPDDFGSPDSIARGRELFFGATANCVKCHGETSLGDGVLDDYDEWTKELSPTDPERIQAYRRQKAILEPRPVRPRNLRLNVLRGGRRPIDLYWRIHNGIAGSPMPAAAMKPDGADPDDPRLSTDDVWHIIAYVRHLPFEPISEPPTQQPMYQRDRQ